MSSKAKIIWWIVALIAVIGAVGAYVRTNGFSFSDESMVRSVVADFGARLKDVSLLAPADDAARAMQANYTAYVAPDILTQWEENPADAPGRLTSSPWPDHIEISSVKVNPGGFYTVSGNVVEMTSADAGSSGGSGKYPVTITLQKRDGVWLIIGFAGYPPR